MTVESAEGRIRALGLVIPEAPASVATYVPVVQAGQLLIVSGQLPIVDGRIAFTGQLKPGDDLAEGVRAARTCMINVLSQVRAAAGSLDRVARIVRIGGFVNAAPGFTDHPKVVNGASELAVEVFGERGKHARAAVGNSSLPFDATVEVEAMILLKD
jgi:enamine deaminase RidA (YjgF/YER057c/UK114 family)